MAVRAQTSIEFLLILSAVVLVVLAGVMSLSEIMKVQQGAYSATRGGVENASTGLLTYLSNESFGTGFYPVSGSSGEYANASLVSLEIKKSEPYFLYQPSMIQLTAWNNYPNPMKVPHLLIWVVNASGNETSLSVSDEYNVTVVISHTITSTFVPSNPGVYNVTAVAQDDNGSVLVNPLTNESVVVRTNFTVLDARAPASGFVRTFNIDKKVVAKDTSTYTEIFSLPQDAVIYSAVLEITDAHLYEDRSASAQASYGYSQISPCTSGGDSEGISSSNFFSQQGTVEIPQESFITGSLLYNHPLSGSMEIYVNGVKTAAPLDVVKPGLNTVSITMQPASSPCPPGGYGSNVAAGDATLVITYYASLSETADPSTVTGIAVNGNSIPANSVTDISKYLKGGDNTLSFGAIHGSFNYRLVVNYAES
ncbi:MAG: hypothetical protein NT130_01050 [Candidatus Micrarchaeota archaeon]|nr:hypothetical protein [Candidatus Micrarchaeota archaeon]